MHALSVLEMFVKTKSLTRKSPVSEVAKLYQAV